VEESEEWNLEDAFFYGTPENRVRKNLWKENFSYFATEIRPWLTDLKILIEFLDQFPKDIQFELYEGDFFNSAICLKGIRIGFELPTHYIFYMPDQYKHGWLVEGRIGIELNERWFNPRTGEWYDSEPEWGIVSNDWILVLERV
jgi:hypothetical protein